MTDLFRVTRTGHVATGSPLPGSLSDNLRLAAGRGQVQAIKDLLVAGAGLEPDQEGRNALHFAAQEGHAEVCRYLAAHGCDVNMQDAMGCTPLHKAAAQGAKDAVQMLLDAGCVTDMQDEHGNTAIHETCWNGFSQTAELLVKYNCNVCLTNKAGFTALHLAAQNGHNECSRVVLYAGCNPDIKNNYGDTALHTAARYGHAGVARILISARCKLSEQNKNGDTALHISAALKRRKIAKILVESGIDTELLNKQNERAVDVARRKEHPEIILIITSYSEPRSPSSHRLKGEHSGVTFKESLNFEDKIDVCQENETHHKHEPKAEKQEKGRQFFFFKKKKKDKDKAASIPATSHTKTEVEHHHPGHGKPAVHGFFSQYVPRDGLQLYRDLAGNVKQGPIGYAPVCQCGPSLRRLENSITDTRDSLQNRIDASHHILSHRIDTLGTQTKQQAHATEVMMQDRLNDERGACNARISERLQEERLETHAMFDQANAGMKEELEYWLNDKLASYGHCLDHHHDDSALPPRNLFFDFPTSGRLIRSRSDETLSASDCSGKFRKKDFYASRQAAMQQIRGWDVPTADSYSNQDRSRRRQRNNNVIPSSNKIVTHAQVHSKEIEKLRNNNDTLSPNANLTRSPGILVSSSTQQDSVENMYNTENVSAVGRSGHLSWKQLTPETSQRNYLSKPVSHPRVTFASDHQKQHVQQHQRPGFSSPPSGSQHDTIDPVHLGKQSLRKSVRGTSPGPQKQQSWWSQQNLPKGGPPSTDMKSSKQEDSHIPSLTGQESNLTGRNTRQQNIHQSCQDGYGFHYDQPRTLSADTLLNEESHLSCYKDISRCHSVENTLDDNDSKKIDIYNSGYFTDSAVRPSSAGSNSRNIASIRSTHSASPASRTTYRYRLPETSTNPDHAQPETYTTSAFNSSQINKSNPSKQISSHAQNPTNSRQFLNKTIEPDRKTTPKTFQDTSRELAHSKMLYKSSYGLGDIRNDTSGHGTRTFSNHDPVIYSKRSDSTSKSEGNLTSHSVHFTSPVKDCLQHESLISANTVPSPTYATGNKEDSTCSSNQDSGYGSKNHGGGQRTGVDTSGGTPSSSFSMERSGCNTPSNADSPYTTHCEFSNTGTRTFVNNSTASTVYDNEYHLSPTVLLHKNTQGLPDDSRRDPSHRESSFSMSNFDVRETFVVNRNPTVPFRHDSLRNFITKPSESLQGSNSFNRSSHLPPFPPSKPELQQMLSHQTNNSNMFTSHVGYSKTTYSPAEKLSQNDRSENIPWEGNRQRSEGHVDVSEKPSFQQNSLNKHPFSLGRESHFSSPQSHSEQNVKPALPHYNGTSLFKQTPQTNTNTLSNYSNNINTSQSKVSNNQQQNQGNISQSAVQEHIQGWYQRKLMEAAQRLRQNHNYSQHNLDQHESRTDINYQQKQNSDFQPNQSDDHLYNYEQTLIVRSQNKPLDVSPAANFRGLNNAQYGSRSQSRQKQWSYQNSTQHSSHDTYLSYNYYNHGAPSQHQDGTSIIVPVSEWNLSNNNITAHTQSVGQSYDLKTQNNGSTYPPSMQAMTYNKFHYDPVQGSDV